MDRLQVEVANVLNGRWETEGRGEVFGGRKGISGQLQRWSHRPAPAQAVGTFSPEGQSGQLRLRPAQPDLPPGFTATGQQPGGRHPRHRINGGYFIFKREIFNYMRDKEELVKEPFHRLLQEKQLMGYTYDGFWASMDTFKDKQQLESMYATGTALGNMEEQWQGLRLRML